MALLPRFLVSALFLLASTQSDDVNEGGPNLTPTHSTRGFHIGDTCQDSCSIVIENSYCNLTSNTCQCLESHPIVIEGVSCVDARALHEDCTYDQQCKSSDRHSNCLRISDNQATCTCRAGYHAEFAGRKKRSCVVDDNGPLTQTSVPAIVGLGIGLTILSFLLCFMFKLFSRARWVRARGYGNANCPPPTIVLEGTREGLATTVDIEKQLYKPACVYTNTTPEQILKLTRNGSSKSSRSSRGSRGSVGGLQGNGGTVTASSSKRPSLRSNAGLEDVPELFAMTDGSPSPSGTEYEQHLTIVPNPRAKRRGSIADYAFPELHPRAKSKQEPENLLILTRTHTDKHGRRHSVAVPLVPPKEGEKFEGGYTIEKNPITGGAKLVPPSGSATRSASERRGRRHSFQVGGAGASGGAAAASTSNPNQVAKDMEKLKIGNSVSPRIPKKRPSSRRKGSTASFLHFLDLAIAN